MAGVGSRSRGLVKAGASVVTGSPRHVVRRMAAQALGLKQQEQPELETATLAELSIETAAAERTASVVTASTAPTVALPTACPVSGASPSLTLPPAVEHLTQSKPTKTIHDLNGPPAWPLLGNFVTYIKKENRGRLHEALADQHKRYGRMFKEKLGPNLQLHVADPTLFETIYRNEGKYPERPPIQSWKLYRRVTGKPPGILTSDGPTWHRIRRLLSKPVLPPKAASEYMGAIHDISSQMVDRLVHVRDKDGHRGLANTLPNELYKWALESVAAVALGARMGCLQEDVPERAQAFIDAALDMMTSSLYVMIGEEIHYKLNTRFWRKHKESWDQILDICGQYITEQLEQIEKNIEAGVPQPNNLLISLLNDMTDDEILCNLAELLLSGIDTTSNSLCFTLYLLSKHPHVQERLHDEVQRLFRGKDMTYADLNDMSYLRGVIKETQRLYPVATMNVRVLEDDLNLDGYEIPKKTLCVLNHFAVSRDPKVFDRPDEFIPERWIRESGGNKYHPFAHLPFGSGPKGCVGKRVAMLELAFALAQMSQRFKIQPHEGVELRPVLRTLLTPGNAVPVELIDR